MKNSIFYWAFLVVAGMSLTACSSGDDNIADNTTPVTPGSQNKTVILTGTIGVGGDETTRAVSDEGEKSWKVGDKIAINYEKSDDTYARVQGEIKTVDYDTHNATFKATLIDAKNNGNIGFAYPFDKVKRKDSYDSATDFEFDYDAYYTEQDGTTETITSLGLDYARTESDGIVKIAVSGSTATLNEDAKLKNQFSMYKIGIEGALNASLLEIFIANGDDFDNPTTIYRIKPENIETYKGATDLFYVALKPKDAGDKVKVVATILSNAGAMKLDSDYKLDLINTLNPSDYGKFISVDESDDNQAYLCNSDNSTTATICEHTYGTATKFIKGKLYTAVLPTSTKTLVPRAVIAHVGAIPNYCTKFLALALTDVYSGVKSLEDAQALIGGGSWLNDNKIKIDNTVYEGLVMSESGGKIDAVQENSQDANHYATTNITSAPLSGGSTSVSPGWRVPCVTDLRNILSHVSGAPSATTPLGIMDHQGKYYDNVDAGYYPFSPHLLNSLNSVFAGVGTNIDGEFYWLSSQVIDKDGNLKAEKAWRYSFAGDYFIWTESTDQSLARLVFAY